MKNSMILGLLFLLLTCSSFAAPLQLSGDFGRAILSIQLWSWGKPPLGHFINASGKLAANPINDDGLVIVTPRSDA
jgi:hypothetical protein